MEINKLKLPDDWANDYESPITLQIRKIAEDIEEQRANQITMMVSEQMGVYVDKNELARALAYDRDQYRRGYEDGWRARSEDVPQWIPVSERLPEEKKNPNTNDFAEVLCSTVFGDIRLYKYGKPIGHEQAHFWYGFGISDNEVIAWQPLPEPYKEEGEENEIR